MVDSALENSGSITNPETVNGTARSQIVRLQEKIYRK